MRCLSETSSDWSCRVGGMGRWWRVGLSALAAASVVTITPVGSAAQAPTETVRLAEQTLARAVRYFRGKVAVQGSYLWTYSPDLVTRRGETPATASQGWVQPPGTPSVGLAYLDAHIATGERMYLDAAVETAKSLCKTQLSSGGWDYVIEFDPEKARAWHYRTDVEAGDDEGKGRKRTTTLDDDTSQSALRFLMRLDRVLNGSDPELRRAVDYAFHRLTEMQYPNGAWPQRSDGTLKNHADYPVQQSRYPESWSRIWPNEDYRDHYTFNDGAIRDVVLCFLEGGTRYLHGERINAALRGGEFILRAQLPEPQPAWAQQYNRMLEPAWARKFEPPSVTAGESVGVIRTLLDLYLFTGDERWIQPVEPAVAWLKRSSFQKNGRATWARFYELQTNRPLYFTRDYRLVYQDDDLPTHYSFQSEYGVPAVIRTYEEIRRKGRDAYRTDAARARAAAVQAHSPERDARIRELCSSLGTEDRWVDGDQLRCQTFVRNVEALSRYIGGMKGKSFRETVFEP